MHNLWFLLKFLNENKLLCRTLLSIIFISRLASGVYNTMWKLLFIYNIHSASLMLEPAFVSRTWFQSSDGLLNDPLSWKYIPQLRLRIGGRKKGSVTSKMDIAKTYSGIVFGILNPTWIKHATFWSGVRHATIAPRIWMLIY